MQYFKKGLFGALGAWTGTMIFAALLKLVDDRVKDSEAKEEEVKEKYEEYKESEEEKTE